MKFIEKTLSSKTIYDGRVVKLVVEDVLLPNGNTSIREIVQTKNSVGVIPITKDKKVLLVKQFRKPIERVIYEIPAGIIENDEDPMECAMRELIEETGYGNGKIELVHTFAASPGTNRALFYLYIAKDIEVINEHLTLDEDEFIEVVSVNKEEYKQLIDNGEICDLKTSFAYLYIQDLI